MGDVPQKLRYIGSVPDSLFSGRPLAPGDYLDASALDLEREGSEDRRLLDDGLLIDADPPQAAEASESGPYDGLQGQALDDALDERGLLEGNKSKTAAEKRALLSEDDAGGDTA